jgi:hypothetical protein
MNLAAPSLCSVGIVTLELRNSHEGEIMVKNASE